MLRKCTSLRACRGGPRSRHGLHGLRDAQSCVAPPVAAVRRPVGAKITETQNSHHRVTPLQHSASMPSGHCPTLHPLSCGTVAGGSIALNFARPCAPLWLSPFGVGLGRPSHARRLCRWNWKTRDSRRGFREFGGESGLWDRLQFGRIRWGTMAMSQAAGGTFARSGRRTGGGGVPSSEYRVPSTEFRAWRVR